MMDMIVGIHDSTESYFNSAIEKNPDRIDDISKLYKYVKIHPSILDYSEIIYKDIRVKNFHWTSYGSIDITIHCAVIFDDFLFQSIIIAILVLLCTILFFIIYFSIFEKEIFIRSEHFCI